MFQLNLHKMLSKKDNETLQQAQQAVELQEDYEGAEDDLADNEEDGEEEDDEYGDEINVQQEQEEEEDLINKDSLPGIDDISEDANGEQKSKRAEDEKDEPNVNLNFLADENLLNEQMPKGIIHPQSFWKTIWNITMLVFIVFLSISVPYRIAFEDVTPIGWFYTDTILDFLFIIDMSLNFFTAIETDNGEIIVEH